MNTFFSTPATSYANLMFLCWNIEQQFLTQKILYPLFYFSCMLMKSSEEGFYQPAGWRNQSLFYIIVRISLFLWVALLNLITVSSTWARVIDVMDSEVQDYLVSLGLVLR